MGGFAARNNRAAPVSPCVFYKMHEATGATISDSLSNGGALTLFADSTGTPWSNRPNITPDGTNHYVQRDADAFLQSLLRIDTAFGHIIQCLDFAYDGALTGNEAIMFAGTNNPSGGWGFGINSSGQIQMLFRGVGSSALVTTAFAGSALSGYAGSYARIHLMVEIVRASATTVDASLYVNGSSLAQLVGLSTLGTGGTSPYGSLQTHGGGTQAYSLGVRPNAASGREQFLNSAGSNGQFGRWLAFRGATYDPALAAKVALQGFENPGELPECLRGI